MKNDRVWIEIMTFSAAIACALALLIATLGAAVGALGPQQAQATEKQTYEGMVSCSRCGAKHMANLGETAANCARICVHGGAQFALVEPDHSYLLDGDLNLLKKLSGQRVHIVGELSGNTIKVASAAGI